MMPQFDIFSFFSQLFWVLICFGYLYLTLSFYVLPSFAIVLKTRSKKLSQINTISTDIEILDNSIANLTIFDNLDCWVDVTNNLQSYKAITLKFTQQHFINFSLLNNFKTITIFN